MYVPGARERVLRKGSPGVYLVLAVDRKLQLAQLLTLDGVPMVIEDVPVAELEPLGLDSPS